MPEYSSPKLIRFGTVSALTNQVVELSTYPRTELQNEPDPTCPEGAWWVNVSTDEFQSGSAPWPGPGFNCYVEYNP